jgi:GNAT superfamily N-acetyltransferase
VHWLKAVYIPTNQFIGSAAWIGPGAPVHNFWRHSAAAFYNWREQFGWSESDIEEMWKGVNIEAWEKKMGGNGDPIRQKVMGDEPHWYLAPLYVLPDFQGRGVASLLLDWAIQRADATTPPTPMYLESSPRARKIYEHVGFVPIGDANFLRRGPPAWEPKKSVLHEHEPAKEKGLDVRVQEVVAGAPPL